MTLKVTPFQFDFAHGTSHLDGSAKIHVTGHVGLGNNAVAVRALDVAKIALELVQLDRARQKRLRRAASGSETTTQRHETPHEVAHEHRPLDKALRPADGAGSICRDASLAKDFVASLSWRGHHVNARVFRNHLAHGADKVV